MKKKEVKFKFLSYQKHKKYLTLTQGNFIKKELNNKLRFKNKNGVLDEIRTHDLSLRRRLLYPSELREPK